MEKIFEPIKDLIGSVYNLLFDAATKVWSLVKPIFLIGLVVDLVTGKLGWITQILEFYRQAISYTATASWWLVLVMALLLFHFFRKQ